MFIKPYFV